MCLENILLMLKRLCNLKLTRVTFINKTRDYEI